jgi:hypothetical protein
MTGTLQSERREEIEALLARTGAATDRRLDLNGSSILRDQLRYALRGSTLSVSGFRSIGIEANQLRIVAQLRELLDRGNISLAEANAYFGGIYGYDGLFAALPSQRAIDAANSTEVELVEQGETQADVAEVVSSEAQAAAVQGTGGVQPVTIELAQLPDQYRIDSLTGVIRDAFDQVEQHIASIRAGRVAAVLEAQSAHHGPGYNPA